MLDAGFDQLVSRRHVTGSDPAPQVLEFDLLAPHEPGRPPRQHHGDRPVVRWLRHEHGERYAGRLVASGQRGGQNGRGLPEPVPGVVEASLCLQLHAPSDRAERHGQPDKVPRPCNDATAEARRSEDRAPVSAVEETDRDPKRRRHVVVRAVKAHLATSCRQLSSRPDPCYPPELANLPVAR
jgi:hypothetical protein